MNMPKSDAYSSKFVLMRLRSTAWLSILLGLVLHQIVIGSDRLNVQNITWLANGGWGDTWAHYLGWQNYRQSSWQFPIGANNSYGLELASSIVFTDSIPWFAIFFKGLSPFLPSTFQYFGLWILICFILQSYFSWKIVGTFTRNLTILICGTLILSFSPAFLNRVNTHVALSSHFLILAAVYIVLNINMIHRPLKWFLLLIFAAGVHAYFLIMILCLFIADVVQLIRSGQVSIRRIFIRVIAILSFLTIIMWQLGYFVITSGLAAPFPSSLFKVDLLQPFNLSGWSWLASKYSPVQQGNFEGFNYWGLGALGLIILASSGIALRRIHVFDFFLKNFAITFTILCFGLYSLSNEVTLGRHILISYDFPSIFESISKTFRAVGRFFWPVTYFGIVASLAVLTKLLKSRLAIITFVVLSLLQIGDSHYGWQRVSEITRLPIGQNVPDFSNKSWSQISKSHNSIRVFPKYSAEESCDWRKIGMITSRFEMSTNCVAQSRFDLQKLRESQREFTESIRNGTLDSKTLYILNEQQLKQFIASIESGKLNLTRLDNLLIVSKEVIGGLNP